MRHQARRSSSSEPRHSTATGMTGNVGIMRRVACPQVQGSSMTLRMQAVSERMLQRLTPVALSPAQPEAVQQAVRKIQQPMDQMSSSQMDLMLGCHTLALHSQRMSRLRLLI